MKLAINYSPNAAVLVRSGAAAIDLFKCPYPFDPAVHAYSPTLLDDAERLRPTYIHFPLNTCDGTITPESLAETARWRERTRTPYINVHITLREEAPAVDDLSPAFVAEASGRIARDIDVLVRAFGADAVIAENVIYRVGQTGPSAACTWPEAIAKVIRDTGCGLLLDTSHARISASQLGVPIEEYIERLPVERLRELHVTGARLDGDPAWDSMPMSEDDWQVAEWVLRRIREGAFARPWTVALEYGGVGPIFDWRSEADEIRSEIERMRAILSREERAIP
jgi:uncharacterized protein (UPF0276 family)